MQISYKVYLSLICQLQFQNQAKLFLNGKIWLVEANPKKNIWRISVKMHQGANMASELFPASNRLVYLSSGPFLQKDQVKNSLCLVLEIKPISRYVDFRKIATQFFDDAQEWNSLLNALY